MPCSAGKLTGFISATRCSILFQNNHSDSLNIAKATTDSINASTLDINLNYHKPDASVAYFPVWDKFHYDSTRVYIPVELPSYVGNITSFSVIDSSGPYFMVIHAVEHFDGKTILHIEVDIPNNMYAAITYFIKFRITFAPAGIAELSASMQNIKVYPNPSTDDVTLEFSNPQHYVYSLFIYDTKGQKLREIDNISSGEVKLSNENLERGMYFYSLRNRWGIAGQGKFVVD